MLNSLNIGKLKKEMQIINFSDAALLDFAVILHLLTVKKYSKIPYI